MFVRKICFFLCTILFLSGCFGVTSFAARTGEFETGVVEFTAFTPNDFTEPVEILLKHKTEQLELKYYLYRINNYFSNESVPCGDYSVTVTVSGAEEVGYIYEDSLCVEPSANLAVPFTVIIDYSAGEGSISNDIEDFEDLEELEELFGEEAGVDNSEEDTEAVEDIQEDTADSLAEEESSVSSSHRKGFGSLLVSLLFSVLLIVAVGAILWVFKNRL